MQIPLLFDFDLPGCHTAHELLGILLVLARDGIGGDGVDVVTRVAHRNCNDLVRMGGMIYQ
jgi:hypothetical protein